MKQKLSFLLAFCLALLALALALPARAADAVVGNGTAGSCTETAFNNALTTAQAGGGTITFNCGPAPHTLTFTVYKEISSNVTIDGGGQITLDGNNAAAFFQVFNGASLNLKQITLRRGILAMAHPLENFGTLVLDGVTLTQNVSTESAIANFGVLTITNSTLSSNQLTVAGNGGALLNDGGTVQIQNSTFSNNAVLGGTGTGGAISNQNGSVVITGSTFIANNALDGGAIFVGSGTTVAVTQSTFTGNTGGYGAAIESRGNQVVVSRSVFTGNQATIGDGGAIWLLDGALEVDQGQFTNNQAQTTGGAISCYNDAITVRNSGFGNNRAAGNGGAIYSTCALTMSNVTFSANQATGAASGGGAIYQAGNAAGTVTYATIAGNTAKFGAGIYNDGGGNSSLTISKSIVVDNATGNCDGVITSGGYNVANDTGCAAFIQTGDQQGVAVTLNPFGNYGGLTSTRPPVAGSPTIDAIPTAQCGLTVDQRGQPRPQGNGCDKGAVEGDGVQPVGLYLYLPLVLK